MEYPKWKYKPAGDSFEGRIAVDPEHEDALAAEGFTYSSPAEFGVVTCPGAEILAPREHVSLDPGLSITRAAVAETPKKRGKRQ